MLLFIECISVLIRFYNTFQNIVCYCLSCVWVYCISTTRLISKHRMLLFIPRECGRLMGVSEFQNIVCYCLSRKLLPGSNQYFPFQNIVCYCLSLRFPQMPYNHPNFKTSYVTVYLHPGDLFATWTYFKTSYVTVYPLSSTARPFA